MLSSLHMSLPLVQLENVDVALEGTPVLRGVTWRLERGESWAVLGGNGSGKSTFLRLVRGELWPVPGRGRRVYALDGDPQTTAVGVAQAMPLVSPETQARCLQMEWNRTVRQLVESGPGGGDYAPGRLTRAERAAAWQAAEQTGITALWRRNIQELSTGELRRALIARALASRPRLIVCDELCDGLDAAARRALLALLQQLAERGTQLLFTTHREDELIPALRNRLQIAGGRVRVVRRRPALAPSAPTPAARPAPAAPAGGATLIRVDRASVYLGRQPALRDIRWELRSGEHWVVTGPNGSGKSTLLRLIAGDVHPALGGSVQRFDLTARNTLWELRRRIGYVSPAFQAAYRENLSGLEVIASGFRSSVGLLERPTPAQFRRAAALVRRLGLARLARKNTLSMSYGEFRRILLARALAPEPRLLVLDEPLDGLDAGGRRDMARVLEDVAAGGTSLVLVTHHEEDWPRCLTHQACLEAGRLVAQGPLGGRGSEPGRP